MQLSIKSITLVGEGSYSSAEVQSAYSTAQPTGRAYKYIYLSHIYD